MKIIGKCKLCLRDGVELQESHYVPAGVYRIMRDDEATNPNSWSITQKGAVQTSKQLKAHLLCWDCEQRLSNNGENWVLANCLKKDGTFRLASLLNSRKPDLSSPYNPGKVYWTANIHEVNHQALAYFAASIFWRGSLYGWNTDGSIPVRLGPFQESFRKYMMEEDVFPRNCVLLLAVREGKEIDRLTSFPVGDRKGMVHMYQFTMPGIGFGITVSKNIPQHLRDYCFVHGPDKPILVTPLIERFLIESVSMLLQRSSRKRSSN